MSPDARESMSEKERYESLCREPWPLVSTVEPQNTGQWSQHCPFQRLSVPSLEVLAHLNQKSCLKS